MDRDSVMWVREYICDHPDASVDTIARAASAVHKGLRKEAICALRRGLSKGGVVEQDAQLPEEKVAPLHVAPPPPPPEPPVPSTTKERRAYLNELLDRNPKLTSREAIEHLKAKFGVALAGYYITETIRLAHEVSKPQVQVKPRSLPPPLLPPPPPPEPPPLLPPTPEPSFRDAVKLFATRMKAEGWQSLNVVIGDDGKVAYHGRREDRGSLDL